MNKSEQGILERLTGKAWGNNKSIIVNAHEKRLVNAVKSLIKTSIVTVQIRRDINRNPYYIVRLNLPAYVCEDCESKYNERV